MKQRRFSHEAEIGGSSTADGGEPLFELHKLALKPLGLPATVWVALLWLDFPDTHY
jgi:hypothetical protein